jgi:hypothetical protein
VSSRFQDGDVGQGDGKQFHDLRRAIEQYLNDPATAVKKRFGSLIKAKIIPYSHLCQKTAPIACFRSDRLGATTALKRTIQTMMDSGMLVEVPRQKLVNDFQYSGVAYGIGSGW